MVQNKNKIIKTLFAFVLRSLNLFASFFHSYQFSGNCMLIVYLSSLNHNQLNNLNWIKKKLLFDLKSNWQFGGTEYFLTNTKYFIKCVWAVTFLSFYLWIICELIFLTRFLFLGHHERQVDEHGLRGGRVEAVHRAGPWHLRRKADRHARHHGVLQVSSKFANSLLKLSKNVE